jgi:hypothetical protein
VPHFLLSYLPWNTLQCLHWKCMPEWKAVNMSFLVTKVGLNVFFSINKCVPSQHYGSTAICVSVVQCNKPTQRHLQPTCRCPTCDDDCGHVVLTSPEGLLILYKSGIFAIDISIVNFQTWPRHRWFGSLLETTEEDLPISISFCQELCEMFKRHTCINR